MTCLTQRPLLDKKDWMIIIKRGFAEEIKKGRLKLMFQTALMFSISGFSNG